MPELGRDTFAIYWHLLSRARAEKIPLEPETEVALFERAIELSELPQTFPKVSAF